MTVVKNGLTFRCNRLTIVRNLNDEDNIEKWQVL